MKRPRLRKRPIQGVNLAELAAVADALSADGRGDLAAHIVEILYYCAERQIGRDNVVSLSARRRGKEQRD